MTRRLPAYAWAGLLTMVVSEVGELRQIEPFWSWHTPIAWTGYILLVDGVIWRKRGESWLRNARAEFFFIACASVPLWVVFELYNKFTLHNWYYVGRAVTLSAIGFIALMTMLRVSGKRTLSKLNVFDFVFVVAVGSVFAATLVEKDVTLVEGLASLLDEFREGSAETMVESISESVSKTYGSLRDDATILVVKSVGVGG